mmetsp:Transcript_26830/g.50616  ORF Transcript_26830/g.50616 Transcript_26830/m.50616 type:complete len:429 (-) Transcript_26830:167-1453(-)
MAPWIAHPKSYPTIKQCSTHQTRTTSAIVLQPQKVCAPLEELDPLAICLIDNTTTMEISPIARESPVASFGEPERLCPDLARDQLEVLLRCEDRYVVRTVRCQATKLEGGNSSPEEWRRKICQWSYRVVDNFQFDRSVVSVAMNILDRFVQAYRLPSDNESHCLCVACKRSMDSRTFQLASMTSLYIAIKSAPETTTVEEMNRRRGFKISTFAELSRGLFSANDIAEMEQAILSTLTWLVNPPTPMTFVPYLLNILPPTQSLSQESQRTYALVHQVLRELSRYVTELGVCLGSELSSYAPSQVAFVAILISMDLITANALPYEARAAFYTNFLALTGARPEALQRLRFMMTESLWPEILIDESSQADPHHPIAVAREYGIIDFAAMAGINSPEPRGVLEEVQSGSPPTSPLRNKQSSTPRSPVSVLNH